MSQKIEKIDINFECIESNSPKILIVGDFSQWSQLYSKPAILRITLPDSTTPSTHTWVKKSLNTYNSVNLGLSCLEEYKENYEDLPDGVYTIELIPSPSTYSFSRFYLKIDTLRLEIDKIYVKTGMEYDTKDKIFRDNMFTIEFLIRVAQAATRLGDIPKAKKNFTEATKLLEKYKECKDCI
jgi:hypothetical protein